MSGPVEIILIIAAVGYVLARRLMGEPAEGRRMLLLPAVLAVVGVVDLANVAQSPVSIAFLVGTTVVSLLFGAARGLSIRISDRGGIVFMRYTWVTIVLWGLSLGIKFGASAVLAYLDPSAGHATSNGLVLSLGAGLLVEGVVVLARAMQANSRIIWQKGKNGQPHVTSPFLDGMQNQFRDAPSRPPYSGEDRDPGR